MRLVELIFERANGTKFSVPFDEARILQDLLAQLPNISQPQEEKLGRTSSQDLLESFGKQTRPQDQKTWPSNWPPVRPWTPGCPGWPDLYKITCEQQPLRFEWGVAKDNKTTGQATQECRIFSTPPKMPGSGSVSSL